MSVATVTRVELYNLHPATYNRAPGQTPATVDYQFYKSYPEAFLRMLRLEAYTDTANTCPVSSALWEARKLWNDAHIENDERTAILENNRRFWDAVESPVVPAPVELDRSAQAVALMAMRRREAELTSRVAALKVQVDRLSGQVKGDDERLTDFWQLAMDEATEQSHCGEYDNMAAVLGGPRRRLTYIVTLERTVTYTERCDVTVEVSPDSDGEIDQSEAQAQAEEMASDWESQGDEDWSDVSVYDYNRQY